VLCWTVARTLAAFQNSAFVLFGLIFCRIQNVPVVHQVCSTIELLHKKQPIIDTFKGVFQGLIKNLLWKHA